MKIEIISPRDLSADLASAWRDFQRLDLAWDSPFLSPGWAAATDRARSDDAVKIAATFDGGRARSFMALRAGPVTALPAGAPMSDYQGFVGESGAGVEPRRLLSALGVHRFDFDQHAGRSSPPSARHARGETALLDRRCARRRYDAYAAAKRAEG